MPNLYPAFEQQEVVVSTPRHVHSLAELESDEIRAVAEAWRARAEAARSEGFGYLHALLNEGALAGSSLPHAHTQLVWLREVPRLVAEERTTSGDCGVCDLVGSDRYLLGEREDVVCLVHPAGRQPYELLIAPRAHVPGGFSAPSLAAALELLADSIRRLRVLEGPLPLNAWLHTAPLAGGDGHWHLEVVPRLAVLAGIELGAGINVNPMPPEDAVAALRTSSSRGVAPG